MINGKIKRILVLAGLLTGLLVSVTMHAQPAFPGAQGWAVGTPGGRGGKIIRVTNLDASGTGSFAAAVRTSDARIVVFEVGGVIDLNGGSITISQPYLTIAGQTAPSPGITLINGSLSISNTHDIVIRHIRVRPGAAGKPVGWEPDGISLNSAHDVILDHCSVSWAVDENMSASGPRFEGNNPDEWRANTSHTVTFSNNIIAEALSYSTHSKGEHSKGSLIHDNVTEMTVIHNLYACNERRNPYFKAGARGVVVNNYIYNPGAVAIQYNLVDSEWGENPHQLGQMSIVGNFMQYGPDSQDPALMDADAGDVEIYMEDNIAVNQRGGAVWLYDGIPSKLVDAKPVWPPDLVVLPAADNRKTLLDQVGACPWDRDEIDQRIVAGVLDGTGEIIDFETEVGGFPDYPETHAPFNEAEWDLSNMMSLLPAVQLKTPHNNEVFELNSPISVHVDAEDYDGTIDRVELFFNNEPMGTLASAPYEWQLLPDSTGVFRLHAEAEDNDGRKSSSDTIHIQIVEQILYQLKIDQSGSGLVKQTPEGTVFRKDSQISLTAVPSAGFEFAEWSGDYHGGKNPVTLNMTGDRSVTAVFLPEVEPELNVHLAFDGLSRTTVPDLSGNLHLAFINNMNPLTLTPGPFGDGLQFDGLDDYLRVFRKDDLDFTSHGFTLVFWVYQTGTGGITPWLSFMEGDIGYSVFHNADDQCVSFEIDDGYVRSEVRAPDVYFITEKWIFVAAVARRNPDRLVLYADGDPVGSAEDSTGILSNTARYIYIGTDPLLENYFKGAIDELRIYNYALDDQAIQKLYQQNSTIIRTSENPCVQPIAVSCYPNPFNPATTIVYQLLDIQDVELKIYNIQGQNVATLEQGMKTPGIHRVRFNAENLPNGVYMIRLNTGNQFVNRKIALIR
jgi:pectate lyase